jgi:CelD/BcsL family acetyltransferase involved in cellulose biosynthesis
VPFLVTVEAADRLVGLMTLVLDDRPPCPVVRFAASPFNDLTDLMTLPGHEAEAAEAAIGALRVLAGDGWVVEIEDVDPEGALAGADCDRRPLNWRAGSVAPAIDLSDAAATVSPRHRRRLDRSARELRGAHRVAFRRRDGPEVVAGLEEFMRLRAARLRALGRNLSDPPVTLLDAAVRRLAPLGGCAFMEMLIDDTVVARDLYLTGDRVVMLWLRALDMAWVRHSCGHLLLRAAAERFAVEGYESLDLGRGAELYKFRFGARHRVLLRARVAAGPQSAVLARTA